MYHNIVRANQSLRQNQTSFTIKVALTNTHFLCTVGLERDIEDGTRDRPLVVATNPMLSFQPTNDNMKLEFPKLDLEELLNLGNGAYGRAFLGRANGIRDNEKDSMVVVKSLYSNEDHVREQFNKEMEALCGLQHNNVVALLGVCSRDEPFYMIFELMEKVCV